MDHNHNSWLNIQIDPKHTLDVVDIVNLSSSTSSMDYSLPRLRTKFGERAFSNAGPATWNALPDHMRTVAYPVKFRKLLQSHYFSQAFNIC